MRVVKQRDAENPSRRTENRNVGDRAENPIATGINIRWAQWIVSTRELLLLLLDRAILLDGAGEQWSAASQQRHEDTATTKGLATPTPGWRRHPHSARQQSRLCVLDKQTSVSRISRLYINCEPAVAF